MRNHDKLGFGATVAAMTSTFPILVTVADGGARDEAVVRQAVVATGEFPGRR